MLSKNFLFLCFMVVGCQSDNMSSTLNSTVSITHINSEKIGQLAMTELPTKNPDNPRDIKPSDPKLTNHLQEEFNFDEVSGVIHNFCTPMLDECEPSLLLKYKNQTLNVPVTYPANIQFSKNNILKKGNLIIVDSATGGNCFDCTGVDVFKLENEKILQLGYFDKIEGNFLVSSYTNLEMNDITGHGDAPLWYVYYKDNGKLIFDINKTCNLSESVSYNEKKLNLLKEINSRKNKNNINKKLSEYDEIYSLILYVLSFSKWCDWKSEELEVASKIKNSYLSLNYDKVKMLNKIINDIKPLDDSSVLKKISNGAFSD